jgi:hypothetical protein
VVLLLALRHRTKARAQPKEAGEAKPSLGGFGGWSGASEATRSGTPR